MKGVKMKKIFSLVLSIVISVTSAVPAFALTRLDRPVIDDIWHESNNITITWNEVDYAQKYKIYRSTSKGGNFEYYDSTEYEYYSDFGITKGVRYYYKIKAIAPLRKASKLSKWRSEKLPKPVSQTVYITATGSKYHRYGCQYLRQSCYSISKSDAKAQGYTACSRCW